MSSRCRSENGCLRGNAGARHVTLLLALAVTLLLGACERERREFAGAPQTSAQPSLTTLQPGAPQPEPANPVGVHYENNAFHVSEGTRLFSWFNCNGCHANGGGAIGPALMDAQWRYGGDIDQIYASIMDGRPNGMPAWRNKLTDQQAWQLAAYVRALAGNVRKDAVPSRRDAMSATPPLTQLPEQPPQDGDASAQSVPPQ